MKNSEQDESQEWWLDDPWIEPGHVSEELAARLRRMSEAMRKADLPGPPPLPREERTEPFNLQEWSRRVAQEGAENLNRSVLAEAARRRRDNGEES